MVNPTNKRNGFLAKPQVASKTLPPTINKFYLKNMSLAEEITSGEICALCQLPFEEEVGFPVAYDECWDEDCGYQESPVPLASLVDVFEDDHKHPDEDRRAGRKLTEEELWEELGLPCTIFDNSDDGRFID